MVEKTPPSHGPAPGISRPTAFRPDLTFRVALTVLAVAFALLTAYQALRADLVATVLLLAFLVTSTWAATRVWTTRVWVETSYPTGWVPGTSPDPERAPAIAELLADMPASRTAFVVEQAALTGLRRREALLEHPSTITLSGTAFTGARPSWRVAVTEPATAGRAATTVSVRAPWLTDVRPLLARLRVLVERDERLAADPDTLALVLGRRPLDEPR